MGKFMMYLTRDISGDTTPEPYFAVTKVSPILHMLSDPAGWVRALFMCISSEFKQGTSLPLRPTGPGTMLHEGPAWSPRRAPPRPNPFGSPFKILNP